MKTSRDSIHDQLVATYQSLEGAILNKVLREQGIDDEAKRRQIISSFLFEQGVVLDQCWFKEEEKKWYPGVFFSTKPHADLGEATVYLPSDDFGMNFHEYAHGATDWALENENGPDEIEVGNE